MKVKIKYKTNAILGILDFERKQKQPILVKVVFEYKYKDKFINYKEVLDFTKKIIKKKKFFLIEEAIIYLKDKLNKKYKIKNLKIEILKEKIIKNAKVSIRG